MHVAVYPGFPEWLRRRGVPMGAAHRASFLNRNITEDRAEKNIATMSKLTFGQQAAHALKASFDWRDSREGDTYWAELVTKLETQ